MSRDASIRLSDFLEGRFGDRLRAVVHYDDDGHDIEYVRDDPAEHPHNANIEEIIDHHRSTNVDRQEMEELVGERRLNAYVGLYEDLLEIHFPHGQDSGTVATLEAQALGDLYSMVGDCLTVIGSQQLD